MIILINNKVTFKDPLNDLEGKEKYGKNVAMLSGDSMVGNLVDCPGDVQAFISQSPSIRHRWCCGKPLKHGG